LSPAITSVTAEVRDTKFRTQVEYIEC